ncbi:MAG TPA: hypothetical protein PLQ76_00245 [bacterium]|nr:hypothetical protein [bacterium]
MAIEAYDSLSIWRCPSLGGPVPFSHCRKTNNNLPCQSIVACWSNQIDLQAFLSENYTHEELQQALGVPKKSRIETILEALDKSKQK